MKPTLSLIIAVYNAVRYLEFILAALERQTLANFEVIIADDGSGNGIRELVEQYRHSAPFPLQHLWQTDAGFRKNRMLNKAILAAKSDYLVFIDGDCVPHHKFLEDHHNNKEPMRVLCGRRVNFSRPVTEKLTVADVRSGASEQLTLNVLLDGLMARSSNLEDRIRIESPFLRRMLHRDRARILGCNFSVEKPLLERINGFDEEYIAPGIGEDTDIAFRLELAGARLKTLRYLAVLYHMYHPATMVGEANKEKFERVVAAGSPMCRRGIRNLDEIQEPAPQSPAHHP